MKKIATILIFILISVFVFSQEETGVDKFFDDGGISTSKNLIKFNVAALIVGDLSLTYERVFTRTISLEISGGVLLPYYTTEIPDLIIPESEPDVVNPKSGYSFMIMPRFYALLEAPDGYYFGFMFRTRHYNLDDGNSFVYNDYTLNYGYQFIIHEKLFMDLNMGFGIRADSNPYKSDTKSPIIMPFAIKLSYIF